MRSVHKCKYVCFGAICFSSLQLTLRLFSVRAIFSRLAAHFFCLVVEIDLKEEMHVYFVVFPYR